jgi:toxin YoeB
MKYKLIWNTDAWEDYIYWSETDKKILKKINEILKDIDRTPYTGIAKPEKLMYGLKGCWSRRITQEHRLVYYTNDESIIIISCRFHYTN